LLNILILRILKVPMTYIIEGNGALVNESGEEQPLKAGDFALVKPGEKNSTATTGISPSR
jgi:uncharacterized cupin superfamily protein